MAGIKGIIVGIVWFFVASFFPAGALHLGSWVIPVVLILAILVGFGEFTNTKKKWAQQRVQRIEQEEIIRERIRRQMRDE
jgi:hypothetical protein